MLLRQRLFLFSALMAWQYLFDATLGGYLHHEPRYWAMAISDTLIVIALPYLARNNLIYDLQRINTVAVFTHGYGLAIYSLGFTHLTYNLLISILAILQIVRILWVRDDDTNSNRIFEMDYQRGRFYHLNFNLQRSNIEETN